MVNVIDFVSGKIAAIAKKAAFFSAGTASCCGMHEPELPENLKKL